jgi:hypothetical protein
MKDPLKFIRFLIYLALAIGLVWWMVWLVVFLINDARLIGLILAIIIILGGALFVGFMLKAFIDSIKENFIKGNKKRDENVTP